MDARGRHPDLRRRLGRRLDRQTMDPRDLEHEPAAKTPRLRLLATPGDAYGAGRGRGFDSGRNRHWSHSRQSTARTRWPESRRRVDYDIRATSCPLSSLLYLVYLGGGSFGFQRERISQSDAPTPSGSSWPICASPWPTLIGTRGRGFWGSTPIRTRQSFGYGILAGGGLPSGADGLCAHLVDAIESMRKNKGVQGSAWVDLHRPQHSFGLHWLYPPLWRYSANTSSGGFYIEWFPSSIPRGVLKELHCLFRGIYTRTLVNTFSHPLGAPLTLPTALLPSETRLGWPTTGTRGEGFFGSRCLLFETSSSTLVTGRGGCPPETWYKKMTKKYLKNEHSTTIDRGLFLTDSGRTPPPRGAGMRMGGWGASRPPFQLR